MRANGFAGKSSHATVMGDLYVVVMALTSETMEPRIVIVKDCYLFEGAPNMLLSYPRLNQKGCELFISKENSHLRIPDKGDGFRVKVHGSEPGEFGMPYLSPVYVGSKKGAIEVYTREVQKTHWHLNAVANATDAQREAQTRSVVRDVPGAEAVDPSSKAGTSGSRALPIGDDTTRRMIAAATQMVTAPILGAIREMKSPKIGLISVGCSMCRF